MALFESKCPECGTVDNLTKNETLRVVRCTNCKHSYEYAKNKPIKKRDLNSLSNEEEAYMNLIGQLVLYRLDKDISAKTAAEMAGLEYSVVKRLESMMTEARLTTIMKYANVLGLKIVLLPKDVDEIAIGATSRAIRRLSKELGVAIDIN